MRKIVIAGEIYSPNLGDGVIHQCLVYLYQKMNPALEIMPLDISGREGWVPPSQQRLTANLSRLGRQSFPKLYRWLNVARLTVNYRRFWKSRWRKTLMKAEALIVGGGQLIMDNDLDFPCKLRLLTGLAQEMDIPVYFQAVGVGARWSRTGKKWVQSFLQPATGISVRDEESRRNCYILLAREDIHLTADPAFWSDEVYDTPHPRREGWIGIGLLNLVDFNTHRLKDELLSLNQYLAFWRKVGNEFLQRGYAVEYFTNGNVLDEALAARLRRGEDKMERKFSNANRPVIPSELAGRVSSYQAVFAARYHANLLAGVYGIPAVGLDWDEKVRQFYRDMGCEERVIAFHDDAHREVVERLLSLTSAVPAERINRCKALAWEDVAWTCKSLG